MPLKPLVAEAVPTDQLSPYEADLYADITRATVRASARGVDDSSVLSMMIAVLARETVAMGVDVEQIAEGVRTAVEFRRAAGR